MLAEWMGEAGLIAGLAVLLATSLATTQRWWHIGLAAAGLLIGAYAWGNDRSTATMILAAGLVLGNLGGLMRFNARNAPLDDDAMGLFRRHLHSMSPGDARLLADQGSFVDASANDVLTQQDVVVERLYFLARGVGVVEVDGKMVGRVGEGDLVGEAALIPNGKASATVRLVEPGRLWFIPRNRLDALLKAQPGIARALASATLASLRDKLDRANRG
jgi:CRP/FNR family transcriptional regulator, cyclic AMP receptor protein